MFISHSGDSSKMEHAECSRPSQQPKGRRHETYPRTISFDAPQTIPSAPPPPLSLRERDRLRGETEHLVSSATEAERQRGLKLSAEAKAAGAAEAAAAHALASELKVRTAALKRE